MPFRAAHRVYLPHVTLTLQHTPSASKLGRAACNNLIRPTFGVLGVLGVLRIHKLWKLVVVVSEFLTLKIGKLGCLPVCCQSAALKHLLTYSATS